MFNLIRDILILIPFLILPSAWAAKCEANYDKLGIPHIKTGSVEEFYYCFGYQHAKDRAWEMDFLRRVAQGRNAEVLGFAHLKSDLMMRLLNLPRKAQELWEELPADERRWLQSYADGVNEGFKTGKSAREFADLGYLPHEWLPVDSLSVLLTQSFDQTRKTFYRDYLEEKSLEDWGSKARDLFDHDNVPWDDAILKEGEYPKGNQEKTTIYLPYKKPKLWAMFPTLLGEASGSNNWVVSAKKSKTGHALLANDPHLDLKTPLFWYWLSISSPQGQMVGGSLPGVPVIASGTNGKVAWGLTNSYINTADAVYLKDPSPDSFETIRPFVWIKFGFMRLPFFFKSFERLKSGQPVLPLEVERDDKMVLRWSGFAVNATEVVPLFKLIKVSNVSEMNEVLKEVKVPAWNFVFADTQGEIGYRMVGKSYRHREKLPFGIPTLSSEEFLKEEFLSADEVPHVLKPKREYVYTANNRHWPQDAAFYGGRGYSHGFRGLRINELLTGKHDIESFKAIQCDQQVVDARFFVPKLLKYVPSPVLANWKMTAHDSSGELSLYRRFMDIIMEEWKVDEYALFRMLDKLDVKQHEEIRQFYAQAVKDVNGRGWGEIHRLDFPHLSNDERWMFSPEISGVGDTHTVNPGTSRWNEDKKIYQQYSGASMRMIVEMTSPPKIYLSLPGFNREYATPSKSTPWQDWKECRYQEVSF